MRNPCTRKKDAPLRSIIIALPALLILTVLFVAMGVARERKATKLAEGVYVIQHDPAPTGFPNSNTTVIIGEREVFVIDGCFIPSAAREDIAQIRQWTDKPVRYLLNTHWHNDHTMGNSAYVEAFPSVAIIAHTETKKDMDLYISSAARRFLEGVADRKQRLVERKNADNTSMSEQDKSKAESELATRQLVADEYKTVVYRSPTLTFEHELTIDLGNREVQVRHLGRGNTLGDAVVFLPKENIVITGDLLVRPIPYTFDGYPTEWIKTLEAVAQLDPHLIVPGHGEVMRDKKYLYAVRDIMKSAIDQVNAQLHNIGPAEFHTLDEVKNAVNLSAFHSIFVGNDKSLNEDFDEMVTYLIKLVFNEAALR